MARVPASEATRKRLKQLFEGGESADRSALIRESVRLMIEEALEAEVTEALGRGYFEHGASAGAYRNGYRCGKLKAAEGEIEYGVPQVRGLSGWRSEVRAAVSGKSEALERLAIEMYARGLSLRDIEAAFTDTRGRCVLSRTAASTVAERLWSDYQEFATRSLSELRIVYLFV